MAFKTKAKLFPRLRRLCILWPLLISLIISPSSEGTSHTSTVIIPGIDQANSCLQAFALAISFGHPLTPVLHMAHTLSFRSQLKCHLPSSMTTHLQQSLSHFLAYHSVPVCIALYHLILLSSLFSLLSSPHHLHKHSSPLELKLQVLYVLFFSIL